MTTTMMPLLKTIFLQVRKILVPVTITKIITTISHMGINMEAKILEPRITTKNRAMIMTRSHLPIQTLEIPEMFDKNHSIISMIILQAILNLLVLTFLEHQGNPNKVNLDNLR